MKTFKFSVALSTLENMKEGGTNISIQTFHCEARSVEEALGMAMLEKQEKLPVGAFQVKQITDFLTPNLNFK